MVIAEIRDSNLLRNSLVPVQNLLVQGHKVLALQFANEHRVKVVHQAPDLGTQPRKGD